MPRTRFHVLVLLCAGVLLFLLALPALSTLTSPPPPATTPDPAVTALLDQALAELDPRQRPFLETNVWQRIRLPRLEYESEGRYLVGTDHRYRMEFHTRMGDRQGSLVQVCDGSSLWQGTRTRPGPWDEVRRIPLQKSQAGPVMPTDLGARGFTFSGVQPLLARLRQQLLWVRQEKVQGPEGDCVRLTGVFPPAVAEALAPASKPWPEDLPNQCRLWLDSRTLWPRRVEWLSAGSTPRPLVEMELRSPQFPREMTPERCQIEFAFQPGDAPVIDLSRQGGQPPSWHQEKKTEKLVF